MKAILCTQFGPADTLVYEQNAPDPIPGPGDIVIDVKACGLGFPDGLIIENKYQFKPPLPFSPGGEVAGVVSAVGEKVKHLRPGDAVMALSGWGGFAEKVAVNAKRAFPLPPGMDFLTSASVLYTYGTSYHALKDRAELKPGETLLVLGAGGGVGLTAVELGKLMGAKVIAAASSEDKLAVCREKGASHTINYSTENLRERLKEITEEQGVDVIYDPVGGDWSEQALRSIAWKGRFLVVGFAAGDIPKLPLNLALLKGCSVMGVFWGSFAEREPQNNLQNFLELFQWMQKGHLSQHIHRIYPLEQAPQAIIDMQARKLVGKAIIKVGDWEQEVNQTPPPQPAPAVEEKPKPSAGPAVFRSKADFQALVGQDLGTSQWLTVSQEMINQFAAGTLDHQWIHVDVERAKNEMPDGKTIAHGFLSLSLIPRFIQELIQVEGLKLMFNYGTNKIRFPKAVPAGSRLRMSGSILAAEDMPDGLGLRLTFACTIELEGESKPACVAEMITALYW
jgi:NADPH:quinone reductase